MNSKTIEESHKIPRERLIEKGFSAVNETELNNSRLIFYSNGWIVVILQLWDDGGWDLYMPASLKNNIDSQFAALENLIKQA